MHTSTHNSLWGTWPPNTKDHNEKLRPSSNLNVSDSGILLCIHTFEVKYKSYILLTTSSVNQGSVIDNRSLLSYFGQKKIWYIEFSAYKIVERAKRADPGCAFRNRLLEQHKDWSPRRTASFATLRRLGNQEVNWDLQGQTNPAESRDQEVGTVNSRALLGL